MDMEKKPANVWTYFYERCQEIVDILAKVHRANSAIITERAEEGLVVRAASKNEENNHYVGEFIAYQANLFCFKVIDSKSPLYVKNDRLTGDQGERLPPVAYYGYPVLYADGSVFGTVCIMGATPSDDIVAVRGSIDKFRAILERELWQACEKQLP